MITMNPVEGNQRSLEVQRALWPILCDPMSSNCKKGLQIPVGPYIKCKRDISD